MGKFRLSIRKKTLYCEGGERGGGFSIPGLGPEQRGSALNLGMP